MRKRFMAAVGLVAVASMAIWISGATAKSAVLRAGLTGEKEVAADGTKGVGDPDGQGRAVIRINVDEHETCFRLSWKEIGAPSMAHIHEGSPDEAGPVVITLFATGDEAAPGDQDLPETISSVGGCVPDVDETLLIDIKKNPENYYVNVHNNEFPGGAIRGQLRRPRD